MNRETIAELSIYIMMALFACWAIGPMLIGWMRGKK